MQLELQLLAVLVLLSSMLWLALIVRQAQNRPIFPAQPTEERDWNLPAVMMAACWVGIHLVLLVTSLLSTPGSEKAAVDSENALRILQQMCVINGMILGCLLPATASFQMSQLRQFGIHMQSLGCQLRDGALTFGLSLLPVYLVLGASLAVRSEETEHSFLKLLRDNPSSQVIAWLILGAVVLAPLAEELVYRVLLQGWLSTRLKPWAAIVVTSFAFAAVHGFPDSLPLFPFAMVLGFVYQQRNSYIAVVVAHAAFNLLNVIATLISEG